ncbi:MAG: hypothetical protein GC179_22555 [Anaerolineaceae bacterium]|nr:hypothetical protein [Anaerolineaceae bacterium]
MKSRLFALCLLFIIIAAMVPGVMAQDTTICGNLSADDCTALTSAITNTGTAGSGAFTLDINADIQSDDPTQAGTVSISADGKFNGFAGASMDDVMAMNADPAAAVAKLIEGLKSFSGELNINATLPTAAASMTGGEPLVLNMVLVDGVGYLDFSKLPATVGAMTGGKTPTGWAGLDLIDVLTNIGPSLKPNTSTASSSTTDQLAQVHALLTGHLEYTRDGDTFTGTVDLVGLFNDPEFQKLTNMKEITDAQAAAIESLADATFQLVFTLDGDKLSAAQLSIEFPESTMSAFAAASTSSSGSPAPKSMSLSVELSFSGLGEAQTVTAPEGAPVTKFMELMTAISEIYKNIAGGMKAS